MTQEGDVTDTAGTEAPVVAESNAEGQNQGLYAEPKAEPEATEEGATEEQKGKETETAAEGAEGDDAAKPSDGYEFALPEGVELDEAGATAFNELGKELGITQEQVTGLVPFFAERLQQQAESVADAITTQAEAQSQTWREETMAAKDIGEAGMKVAARAVERFGSDSLKQLLNETGMGNHPELARFCMQVGKAIAEDTLETGTGSGANPADNVEERGIYATS